MTSRRVHFEGSDGDRLVANVDLPVDGSPRAWALFAHCFTCSRNLRAVRNLSRALNGKGIAVFRFDFTGLGESEGDFADTNFSSNIQDLVAAARYMAEAWGPPELLIGHSLGGAAVLHATHRLPSVRAVATLGAPSDPAHVLQHMESSREEIEREGSAVVQLAGRPFRIRRQFLEDLEATGMEEVVSELGRPLLILHSPVDETVSVEHAGNLFDMARHPRSFLALDGADHLLLDEADSRYAGALIGEWATRYLDLEVKVPRPPPGTRERVAVRTGQEGFRTEVWADGHYLVADEPRSVGGTEEGPTPYDLLVAGLGACTSMTLGMYARRKEWDLREVRVSLKHERIHAEDEERAGAEEDGDPPRLDRIRREIHLEGELDEEQRTRLLEIAERCPVHRTLERGVEVQSRLSEHPREN